MGPFAEREVVKYLSHKDKDVRDEAQKILKILRSRRN
jgi:hypothetical protein